MATAASNSSLDHLTGVYKNVIDDVIRNVREEFLNEAVDLEVLEDLKQIWLNKLNLSGAVSRPAQAEPPPRPSQSEPKSSSRQPAQSSLSKPATHPVMSSSQPPPLVPVQPERSSQEAEHDSATVIHHTPSRSLTTPASTAAPSTTPSQASILLHPSKAQDQTLASKQCMMAIGETTPSVSSQSIPPLLQPPQLATFQQGMVPFQTPQGTVLVPLSHLVALQKQAVASQASTQDKDVQQIDGYPPQPANSDMSVVQAAETWPGMCAHLRLPQLEHIEVEQSKTRINRLKDKIKGYKMQFPKPGDTVEVEVIEQLDGLVRGLKHRSHDFIAQLDGEDSSSDDDSDGDDDSSVDELGGTAEAEDDDPLNSEDDVDDETEEDKDFDTNDTIVCLWEKVYRVRTKWKFLLKDGIMHLGGYDYVFQKGNGEADW